MRSGKTKEAEFIIPTRYKSEIGSYLSWPVGAKELTNFLLDVPQIKDLQLEFGRNRSYHQGKWPVSFSVVEARYYYHRTQYATIAGLTDSSWSLFIYPVHGTQEGQFERRWRNRVWDASGTG